MNNISMRFKNLVTLSTTSSWRSVSALNIAKDHSDCLGQDCEDCPGVAARHLNDDHTRCFYGDCIDLRENCLISHLHQLCSGLNCWYRAQHEADEHKECTELWCDKSMSNIEKAKLEMEKAKFEITKYKWRSLDKAVE